MHTNLGKNASRFLATTPHSKNITRSVSRKSQQLEAEYS